MRLSKIIKLFERGNVLVTGLRGRGKDMLFANVACRRKGRYVSNVNYDGNGTCKYIPFVPSEFDTHNTYHNFLSGQVKPYKYPHPDGTDVYISDGGIYFPSQYCSELNKQYGGMISFYALSRHLGDCNMHVNVQNINRLWDKMREQSDIYITCKGCLVLFGRLVFMRVMIYEKYESCLNRVPLFPVRRPLLNRDRLMSWDLAHASYLIAHGKIEAGTLCFINKSNYDTRLFRRMLGGDAIEESSET